MHERFACVHLIFFLNIITITRKAGSITLVWWPISFIQYNHFESKLSLKLNLKLRSNLYLNLRLTLNLKLQLQEGSTVSVLTPYFLFAGLLQNRHKIKKVSYSDSQNYPFPSPPYS